MPEPIELRLNTQELTLLVEGDPEPYLVECYARRVYANRSISPHASRRGVRSEGIELVLRCRDAKDHERFQRSILCLSHGYYLLWVDGTKLLGVLQIGCMSIDSIMAPAGFVFEPNLRGEMYQ